MRLKILFSVLPPGVGESRAVSLFSLPSGNYKCGDRWSFLGADELCSPTRGGRRCGECGLGAVGETQGRQGRPPAHCSWWARPGLPGAPLPDVAHARRRSPQPSRGLQGPMCPPRGLRLLSLPPASPPAMLLETRPWPSRGECCGGLPHRRTRSALWPGRSASQ